MNAKLSLLAKLSLVISITTIVLLAFHPAWMFHLRVDIDGQYISNAKTFLINGNLANQGYNEYQPGAVVFFILLSPILLLSNTHDSYLQALFLANAILIILLAVVYKKMNSWKAVIVFSSILLLTGPIILYRFELYVGLCIILSFWLWIKNKKAFSIILLACATVIKIYPLLLFPYYLILLIKDKKSAFVFSSILLFVGTCAILILAYVYLFKVPPQKIGADLSIHSRKPVHAESTWGSVLTILPKISGGKFALGRGETGIFGIASEYVIGPINFYNSAWIFLLSLFYLGLFIKLKNLPQFDIHVPIAIILLFLVTSKILTAQYLLWFTLLIPLIENGLDFDSDANFSWWINFMLVLLVAFISQYVYPLRYNELLSGFYTNGSFSYIFWLLALRNVLLVFLFLRFAKKLLWAR